MECRPQLDGLRAIAVALVVWYHLTDWSFPKAGWVGVDLFFALSGYLITTLLLIEHAQGGQISLRQFWFRRGLRLLPTLAAVLIVFIGAAGIAANQVYRVDTPSSSESIIGAAAAGLYVANWATVLGHSPNGLAHLWSLAVEEQFYVFWPPVVVFCVRRGGARLVGQAAGIATVGSFTIMGFLVIGQRAPLPNGRFWHLYSGTDTRAGAILLGAVLAALEVGGQITPSMWRSSAGRVATMVAVLAVGILTLTADNRAMWFYPWGFMALGLACTIVVGSASSAIGATKRALSAPFMVWLGKRSYALYLWHELFHAWTRGRWGLLGNLLIALPAGVIAAELTFRVIERPVNRFRAKHLSAVA